MESVHKSAKLPYGWLIGMTAVILFISGSFIAVDWLNALQSLGSIYPAYVKPLVSLLCLVMVVLGYRWRLSKRDFRLLLFAFLCILIVDICMSIYVYAAPEVDTGIIFLIGAGLSIVAHLILIVRHAQGFKFIHLSLSGKPVPYWRNLGFPLWFFIPVIALLIFLSPMLIKVNQFLPSLVYALILTTSLWVAWEVVRRRLFPTANAWLLAAGVTSWFITEVVGVVHNIQIGFLSDISVPLTWHFYMPAILLLALSGYCWKAEHPKHTH